MYCNHNVKFVVLLFQYLYNFVIVFRSKLVIDHCQSTNILVAKIVEMP